MAKPKNNESVEDSKIEIKLVENPPVIDLAEPAVLKIFAKAGLKYGTHIESEGVFFFKIKAAEVRVWETTTLQTDIELELPVGYVGFLEILSPFNDEIPRPDRYKNFPKLVKRDPFKDIVAFRKTFIATERTPLTLDVTRIAGFRSQTEIVSYFDGDAVIQLVLVPLTPEASAPIDIQIITGEP